MERSPDDPTAIEAGSLRILELLEDIPDVIGVRALRPEVEQVLATTYLHGAADGEELTLLRLQVIYDQAPRIALRLLEGDDPEHVAQEILFRYGRERHERRSRGGAL